MDYKFTDILIKRQIKTNYFLNAIDFQYLCNTIQTND